MADTGWVNPSSASSTASISPWSGDGSAWGSPTNIYTSNDTYASIPGLSSYSQILYARGFGFSIPAGSTIDGIEVRVERKRGSEEIVDNIVGIVNENGSSSDNKADTVTSWGTSDAYKTYGGATDKWNVSSLTSTLVNYTSFGVAFRAKEIFVDYGSTAYVDHIQMKIYYTEETVSASHLLSLTGVGK